MSKEKVDKKQNEKSNQNENLNHNIEDFKKYLIDLYQKDNEQFEEIKSACPELFEAMDYSFEAGGKRLRPYLMQEAFYFFGGKKEELFLLYPFMLAIEMIHTFSLTHDDLPSIDNDELRRGKESTWKKYGEALGLLSGDALIFRAMSSISVLQEQVARFLKEENEKGTNVDYFIDLNHRVALAKNIFVDETGIYGMVLGETIDTIGDTCCFNLQELEYMYDCKTSALISASLEIGATMAGASLEDVNEMHFLGKYIGRAFQIQDDILDVISTEKELGKPIGSDERNHKVTWVSLKGMDAAKEEVEILTTQSINVIEKLENENPKKDGTYLKNIILSLVDRKN